MIRRRAQDPEAGFATAEFAVALPAVVLVLAMMIGGLSAMLLHHQALHAAGVGARLAARGESSRTVTEAVARTAPDGADITQRRDGRFVTVTVRPHPPQAISWALPDLSAQVEALSESALEDGENGSGA